VQLTCEQIVWEEIKDWIEVRIGRKQYSSKCGPCTGTFFKQSSVRSLEKLRVLRNFYGSVTLTLPSSA
jgi:hypothetical protein